MCFINKLKKKKIIHILLVVVCSVIFFTLVIIFLSSPIHWSYGGIRIYVLRTIPVGTSMEDVIEIAENKNWDIRYTWDDTGYSMKTGHPRVATGYEKRMYGYDFIIGVKSMEIIIDSSLLGSVGVFFGFDEDGKLIDVAAIKYMSVR